MASHSLPLWHRHRFRWVNGIGFALTAFFALWLLAFLVAVLDAGTFASEPQLPAAFAIVGGLSLVASAVLLGILIFGYVLKNADLGAPTPRHLLYAWTCAAGLFFLSQTIALVKVGAASFVGVPPWLSGLYWYFMPVGAVVFLLLLWVNAEGHHYPWEAEDDEEYEEYEEDG